MIEFPGGAFSCMVRNLSEQGAALDIASSIRIPPYFTLVIPTEGSRFYCHSVWRSDRRHSHSATASAATSDGRECRVPERGG